MIRRLIRFMSYNPFTLENKTILITGASGGIGSATAIECAKLGASVIVSGRNKDKLDSLIKELQSIQMADGRAESIICNLADENDIKKLAEQAPALDGVALNAGISKLCPIKFLKRDDFEQIINVNAISQSLVLKELLKKKKIKDGASVVFTASMAGKGVPRSGNAMYGASKAAVCEFAKFAALELASRKIRVNTICPGMVNTKMIAKAGDLSYSQDSGVNKYPLGRYGEPDEIAKAFVYLLSDASSWITGTDLVIDGGLHIG